MAGRAAEFHWRTKSGRVTICDAAETIAVFDPRTVSLLDMRFRRGGPVLLGGPAHEMGVRLFWRSPDKVVFDDVAVESARSGRAVRLTARSHRADQPVRFTGTAEIGRGPDGYVYRVVNTLEVVGGTRRFVQGGLEYLNFMPYGLIDPESVGERPGGTPFPPVRWSEYLYEAEAGGTIRLPLNRVSVSTKKCIHLRREGMICVANHPDGNPAVRLHGPTAAFSFLSMCNHLYDMHFVHVADHAAEDLPAGTRLTAEFSVFCPSRACVAGLLASARRIPLPPEEVAEKRFPVFIPSETCGFETAVSLDRGDHSRVWRPFIGTIHFTAGDNIRRSNVLDGIRTDARCVWEENSGRTGRRCLSVETSRKTAAGWQLTCFDRPRVEPGKRYRFSAWVRTERLRGSARLGYLFAKDDSANFSDPDLSADARLSRGSVSGTTDWTEISLTTPPVPDSIVRGFRENRIRLVLRHEGTGRSFFDDVSFREDDGTGAAEALPPPVRAGRRPG